MTKRQFISSLASSLHKPQLFARFMKLIFFKVTTHVIITNIIHITFFRGSMRVETSGSDEFYFIAPDKYLGDKRFAYTFTLSFKLQQDNATFPAASSTGDVILKGRWFDQPLVTSLSTPPSTGESFTSYQVRLDCNIKRSAAFIVIAQIFALPVDNKRPTPPSPPHLLSISLPLRLVIFLSPQERKNCCSLKELCHGTYFNSISESCHQIG